MTEQDLDDVLAGVGARLRRVRLARGVTLAALARATGISVSTLSRLESGQRKPTLALLLPLARAHRVTLDELVGAPEFGDPRVRSTPVRRGDMTLVPLTRQPGGLQAHKLVIPPVRTDPSRRTHEGYAWLYVLSGSLRLVLAEHDITLRAGEAAEFPTRVPHWLGSADSDAVEILSLFGGQGERMRLRASPRATASAGAAPDGPGSVGVPGPSPGPGAGGSGSGHVRAPVPDGYPDPDSR